MINIDYRLVEEEDALFIAELRSSHKADIYLNHTSGGVSSQIEWIKKYKLREASGQEYYFIIKESGIPKGTYRLYNVGSESFTIGSWLFDKSEDLMLPIKTDIFFSDMGYDIKNLNLLLFDVRKTNKRVLSYHLLKEPTLYDEDGLNYYFKITRDKWKLSREMVMDYFGIN
jgi:hypothetical protein